MGRNSLPSTMKATQEKFNPEPLLTLPEPPHHLHKDAQEIWKKIGAELIQYKLLTNVDLSFFEQYCEIWGLAQKYKYILDKSWENGTLFVDTNSGPKANPNVKQYESLVKTLGTLSEQLGLTPKARGKIGVAGNSKIKGDAFDEFLKQGG